MLIGAANALEVLDDASSPQGARRKGELRALALRGEGDAVIADLCAALNGVLELNEACDDDDHVKWAVALTLGSLGSPKLPRSSGEAVIVVLAESLMSSCGRPLSSTGRQARLASMAALADLQDDLPEELFEPAAPAIAGVLAGEASKATNADPGSEQARALAAFALGRLGASCVPFIPLLTAALDDSCMHVQLSAIGALASLGVRALPATGKLQSLSEDASCPPEVRGAASEVYGIIMNAE